MSSPNIQKQPPIISSPCKSLSKRKESSELKENFFCNVCNIKLRTKVRLEEHQNAHGGLKTFECETCGKRFTHRSSLYNHERTHSDKRPFECEYCSATFKWKNCLKVHMDLHQLENEASKDQWVEDLDGLTYTVAIKNKTTTVGKNRSMPYRRQNRKKKAQSDSKTVSRQQKSSVPNLRLNLTQPLQQVLVQDQTQFYSGDDGSRSNSQENVPSAFYGLDLPVIFENITSSTQPPEYHQFVGFPQQFGGHASGSEVTNYVPGCDNFMLGQQYCGQSTL